MYLVEVIEPDETFAEFIKDDLPDEELRLAVAESPESCVVVASSFSSSSCFFTSFCSFPALSSASNLALRDGIMLVLGRAPVRGPISLEISLTMLLMQFARPKASLARLVTAFSGLKNRFLLLSNS